MNIEIRRATLEDLYIIQTLNNSLFKLKYENFDPSLKLDWPLEKDGKEYFRSMITDEIVFVAQISNQIVGYLAGSLNIQNSYVTKSLAEVDNMCILDEYRKVGVGSKLMDAFLKICKENKIEEVKVTASAKNINAIKFYRKNGFSDFEITLKKDLSKETEKSKKRILITGPILTSDSSYISTYEKLLSMIDASKYEILSPLDTMKYEGNDFERYDRAMNLLKETKFMIAEMSSVSTGQGMELQQAANLNIPTLVIAKTGSKISGLVKGCKNIKNIIYYDDIDDLKEAILKFTMEEK